MENLSKTIDLLNEKIKNIEDKSIFLTESDTIRVLIFPILRALGWNVEEPEDVKSEYRHKPSDNPVDCALFIQNVPTLFVEAKSFRSDMSERKWILQTLNYANAVGVDWCVLTNGKEWRVYKVHHKVEAEEKLFFSVKIGTDSTEEVTDKLSLLGKDQMSERSIDALWTVQQIDETVKKILSSLLDDSSFVKFIHKKIERKDITVSDVKKSLIKSSMRFNYPENKKSISNFEKPNKDIPPALDSSFHEDDNKKRTKTQMPKVKEIFEKQILKKGMRLYIRGKLGESIPESEAFVENENKVMFKNEIITYSDWGSRITGWKSIRIYMHAQTEDKILLSDLRQKMMLDDQ